MKIINTLFISSLLCTPVLTLADDCSEDLNEISNTRSSQLGSDQFKRDMRALRNAALSLQTHGNEEQCEEIVKIMEELLENHEDKLDEKEHSMRISNAQKVSENKGVVLAEDIIGSTIYNAEGKDIGNIESVVIDNSTGAVKYVSVSYGGFIGLGEKNIGIPLKELYVTEDGEAYMTKMTEQELEAAPDLNDKSDV